MAPALLRPGGTIAVFDADWASLTHDAADEPVSAIIDNKPIGMFFAQPRVMRQMPALARRAGLRIADTRSYVFVEMGRADYWMVGIEQMSDQLARAGHVSEASAAAWRAALTRASDAGDYFGSCNYYACLLRPE